MTEIFLIRHAQAEGNIYRMMQGYWDGDLTEQGRREAMLVGERLKDEIIDAVAASDLFRAVYTARSVLKHHPEAEFSTVPELREINVGPWETRFFGDLLYEQPEKMDKFMHDSGSWKLEGAESFEDVGKRGLKALTELAEKYEGKRIAVVSHGITIRSVLSLITGIPLSDTEKLPICGNTAVNRLIYDDNGFRLIDFNDGSHLGTLPRWKNSISSLRAENLNPFNESEYYISCYKDAWKNAHGNYLYFNAETYLKSAKDHYSADNNALYKFYDNIEPVGMAEFDTERGAHAGYGWVTLLYLKEEYRYKGYGIQLLARAIMYYSRLGRTSIRLNVAEDNKGAAAFYKKYGFKEIGTEKTGTGNLLLMEKPLNNKRMDI